MIFKSNVLNLILLVLLFKIFYDYNNIASIENFRIINKNQKYINNEADKKNPISNLYIKINDIINNIQEPSNEKTKQINLAIPTIKVVNDSIIKTINDKIENITESKDSYKKLKDMISSYDFDKMETIMNTKDGSVKGEQNVKNDYEYLKYSDTDKQNLMIQYMNTLPFKMINEEDYWKNISNIS